MKKLFLLVIAVALFAGLALAETNYICVKLEGAKHVVHPATAQEYQQAVANHETNVWFFATTKPVSAYATAGVFGAYDTYAAASDAIKAVDPAAVIEYRDGEDGAL